MRPTPQVIAEGRTLAAILSGAVLVSGGALATVAREAPGATAAVSVVGGTPATPSAGRWTVALVRRDGPGSVYRRTFCVGSLISARVGVTAAHCIAPYQSHSARRRLGVFTGHVLPTIRRPLLKVKAVSVNPRYRRVAGGSVADIAVFELSEALESPNTVQIPDGRAPESQMVGGALDLFGWGNTLRDGQFFPRALQRAVVNRYPETACGSAFGRRFASTDYLCVGRSDGAADPCEGDSGAPLTSPSTQTPDRPVLVGIVSAGPGCQQAAAPSLATRTSSFRSWLVRHHQPVSTRRR